MMKGVDILEKMNEIFDQNIVEGTTKGVKC
jgi:hypothetical protein